MEQFRIIVREQYLICMAFTRDKYDLINLLQFKLHINQTRLT